MSEKILRALMQLFAIIAKVDFVEDEETASIESSKARKIIEAFLSAELNASLVKRYIEMFEGFLQTHHSNRTKKDNLRKRTSVNSVKVLRISSQINQELTQRQKVIVLLRILEFIYSGETVTEQEKDFATTVAESFHIDAFEYETIRRQVTSDAAHLIDFQEYLYISALPAELEFAHAMRLDNLEGVFRVLLVKSVNTIVFRYFGPDELNMNGQLIPNDRNHILNQGSAFKTNRTTPVYYSDVVSKFLNDINKEKIVFEARDIEYRFDSGNIGLHRLDLHGNSGELVGLMGASGSGKTTLMNVLSGNYQPSHGSVRINGIDVHHEGAKLEGVVGFISQDDLLIEELTVFQNLYFNTQLCFNNLTDKQITQKVIDMLATIGLHDVMDLKVGSPLEKTISGGQRKRLNIAMELIREPSVLFVDEPTSGLSSRDSENIMDLLKEMVLKGKLIFVVIHQPSSDIFKMFDKLLILDQGGYPIFEGNPIDAVVYFKTCVNHVNAYERECTTCGNVNPEQIFNIIETKVVDEYGNATGERKISPAEWNERFLGKDHAPSEPNQPESLESPQGSSRLPGKWKQFRIYFKRDLFSKIANRQYMLVNMLEAPFLAIILAFFVKYFNKGEDYTLAENENLPQYLFIAVVVALFLGLTVAAEEIIRDKNMLKRESFLHLSRKSYLFSKLSIMFLISGFQTLFFVLIGNTILEIAGMWLEYWFILFTVSCSANVIGLNISSALNSLKVIYITIPVLIIPQLLFSGVIVKFDKLHPFFSHPIEVPLIGNVMVSRWAYEALVVTQAKENAYMKKVYRLEKEKSKSSWKRDYWIPEMENKISILYNPKSSDAAVSNAALLLANEIREESAKWYDLPCIDCVKDLQHFNREQTSGDLKDRMLSFLAATRKSYNKIYDRKAGELEAFKIDTGLEKVGKLRKLHQNESINDLVTNEKEITRILMIDHRFYQKGDQIYQDHSSAAFFNAPFYVPSKQLFNNRVDTLWANILVIWAMTLLGVITLYYDLLKKLLNAMEKIFRTVKG